MTVVSAPLIDNEHFILVCVLVILTTHWIADFVLQTHWQAANKSKNAWALRLHILVYTLVMSVPTLPIFLTNSTLNSWAVWIGFNGAAHWATDAVTSRINARLFAKQDWHNFFVSVGFDQLIHYWTLFLSFYALTYIWL